MIGEFIAHYRIIGKLGEGGMGAVYRASDTKLGRDVAIKVLPDAFANHADRLVRFTREAQVLASLSHPNIATIHGIEDGAIVMELVDGQTLAERVENGPLPVDEVLPIARQIAEALEAAHERNVIHRDLKPANIKITPEGTVKVLDFGLAKLADPREATDSAQSAPTVVKGHSPTMAGMIMGTAEYMSPEQAAGRPVDKRTDIWSFGVVLWEMLTGRRLFEGETASHTLADVLRAPIDFGRLPSETPRPVQELVRRCLERDAKRRLRDIGEARIAIESVGKEPDARRAASRPASLLVPWSFAGMMAIVAAIVSLVHFRQTALPAPAIRFSIPFPQGSTLGFGGELSPDGKYLAYSSLADGRSELWVRGLASEQARLLLREPLGAGTGGSYPFWSPDSRWLAYVNGGKLKKVDTRAASASPLVICECVRTFRGGTWNADGVILLAPSAASGLIRVPASGGPAVPVTNLDANTQSLHRFPSFLPDGRHFLYFVGSGHRDLQGVYVGDLRGGASSKRIADSDSHAVFVARYPGSSLGHLLYSKDQTLRAVPFDAGRQAVTDEPAVLAKGVGQVNARGAFSAARHGVLAYWAGEAFPSVELKWYGRDGKVLESLTRANELPAGISTGMSLSRDNRRVAIGIGTTATGSNRIWVLDFDQKGVRPIASDQARFIAPVWSPDSKQLAFGYADSGVFHLGVQTSAQAGAPELLLSTPSNVWPRDWSPDGSILAYEMDGSNGIESWVMSLPDRKKHSWMKAIQVQFAPGAANPWWIAYSSNETGRQQVYVESFTRDGRRAGRAQISTEGGTEPRWRADGRELYYRSGDGKLMAVSVRPDFTTSAPTALFAAPALSSGSIYFGHRFASSADGKRFLFAALPGTLSREPLSVVVNWQEELAR